MSRYPSATPCPVSYPAAAPHSYGASDPTFSFTQSTTANLDYTTELQAQFRHAKPRRRPTAHRQARFNPSLDIFEDGARREEEYVPVHHAAKRTEDATNPAARRSMIFQEPARRASCHAAVYAPPLRGAPMDVTQERRQSVRPDAKPTRRCVSAVLADRHKEPAVGGAMERHDEKGQGAGRQSTLRKDPRRMTIYIPSEDTTIMTIHPCQVAHNIVQRSARSPDLGFDLMTVSEEEPLPLLGKTVDPETQNTRERKLPRKSLAVAPKRAPLKETCKPLQMQTLFDDVLGQGGGKENVPPDMMLKSKVSDQKLYRKRLSVAPQPTLKASRTAHSDYVKQRIAEPAIVKRATEAVKGMKRVGSSSFQHPASPAKAPKAKTGTFAVQRGLWPPPPAPTPPRRTAHALVAKEQKPPSKLSVPLIVQKAQEKQESYPILSEDLARPELYEDHWLSYQEIALTQLINSLFDVVQPSSSSEGVDGESLRRRLLSQYHEESFSLLHKRLQASLLFGALSIPKDLLSKALKIKDDVGLRRKFLDLWLETYDLVLLRAAAETVVGREIRLPTRLSGGSSSTTSEERQIKTERKAIEKFLDTFLIRNEDAVRVKCDVGSIASIVRERQHSTDDFGSQGWSWRRTVLRSLMLILILDKTKSTDIYSRCLFRKRSLHKSSAAVLQALAGMLLPSLGDIIRPLAHLNYTVQTVQYPLQEYNYHITNLATDLRDGVLLTRIVELLLYPPTTLRTRVASGDDTMTIHMPTGEELTSALTINGQSGENVWVLSQHLKFPCIGRTQKLFNVQIALCALQGLKGVASHVADGAKADDVVDGHREKTLGLLWGLVGKCGLESLVDWRGVEREIAALRRRWDEQSFKDSLLDDGENELHGLKGLQRHTKLLLSWVSSIGCLHDVKITNLTTSFASTRALEAIVDEYLPFFTPPPSSMSSTRTASPSSRSAPTLSAKLKVMGCSPSFTALFLPSPSESSCSHTTLPIPSADFTLTTLAFLASRLLPPTFLHRAASCIQRFFRQRLARREVGRRVVLMRLARQCQQVVQTRERVVNAAIVLQRAWRRVVEQRVGALVRDVVRLQGVVRGWAVRRAFKSKGRAGRRLGVGGW